MNLRAKVREILEQVLQLDLERSSNETLYTISGAMRIVDLEPEDIEYVLVWRREYRESTKL